MSSCGIGREEEERKRKEIYPSTRHEISRDYTKHFQQHYSTQIFNHISPGIIIRYYSISFHIHKFPTTSCINPGALRNYSIIGSSLGAPAPALSSFF